MVLLWFFVCLFGVLEVFVGFVLFWGFVWFWFLFSFSLVWFGFF